MTIIVAILALGLLIIFHEAGHFLFARWCGMRVHEFSIGFGPRLFFFQRGQTEYSLRAIFLGGYVRIAGMHPSEEDAREPGSFLQSALWKRILVIAAGPFANYVLAFLLFAGAVWFWGMRDQRLYVQKVKPGSLAAAAGLQAGDRLLAVEGVPVKGIASQSPKKQMKHLLQKTQGRLKLIVGQKEGPRLLSFSPQAIPGRGAPPPTGPAITVKKPTSRVAAFLPPTSRPAVVAKKPASLPAVAQGAARRPAVVAKNAAGRRVGTRQPSASRPATGRLAVRRPAIRRPAVRGKVATSKPTLRKPKGGGEAERDKKKGFAWSLKKLGLEVQLERKLLVGRLLRGSPAEKIGLQYGDEFLAVDGKSVKKLGELLRALQQRAKQSVQLTLRRGGKKFKKTVPQSPSGGNWRLGVHLQPLPQVVVSEVKKGSLAAAAGIKKGQQILAVQGTPLRGIPAKDRSQHFRQLLQRRKKGPLSLLVQRGERQLTVKLPESQKDDPAQIGVVAPSPTRVLVAGVIKKSAAEAAGLRAGDRIVAINGQKIMHKEGFLRSIQQRSYKPIQLTVLRGKEKFKVAIPMAPQPEKWQVGIEFDMESVAPYRVVDFKTSVALAAWNTWLWNVRIIDVLGKLISRRSKAKLSGPVGIVKTASRAVKLGLNHFLVFVAILSIHLGLFNLLPIPALDGGRLVFLGTQQIFRLFGKEELGTRIESIANAIGFVLLFGLLILITLKDILRLF